MIEKIKQFVGEPKYEDWFVGIVAGAIVLGLLILAIVWLYIITSDPLTMEVVVEEIPQKIIEINQTFK